MFHNYFILYIHCTVTFLEAQGSLGGIMKHHYIKEPFLFQVLIICFQVKNIKDICFRSLSLLCVLM